jgi:Tol biopolymer transport system component
LWISICVATALLTACQEQINYPTPSPNITLSPASIEAGQPAFTLIVKGANFTPASAVIWNGTTTLLTLFTSTSELTAQVPAALIQSAGSASIVVSTPQPGGGNTLAATFQITAAPSPLPKITSLSPSGVATGSSGFTLTINGSNFVSQSEVSVNGNLRGATGSSTSLSTSISSSDIATAGAVQIVVINPPPNGGTSNTMNLSVTNPVPSLTSLSPTAAAAGTTTPTALTVAGTGFVSNSTVTINGAPHATVFANGSSLTVTLTAADLAAGGVNQIQVFSPGPGGGTSNPLTFAIDPSDSAGLPVLVDLAPSGAQANNGICGTPCTTGVPTLTTAGPSTSLTGQFVAFASTSTNLLSTVTQQNLTNGTSGIFFRDTCLSTTSSSSSCTPATLLLTTGTGGNAANGPSSEPSLDSAGANVAFTSTATNLVSYVSTPGSASQVYWQPTCENTTASGSCTPVLVSLSADESSAGNGPSYNPVISPDGQYIAFVSLATNLVSGVVVDGVTPQVYVRTICAGVTPLTQTISCVPTTYLVSTPDGVTPGNQPSSDPAISNTGLYVSFSSTATNLGATAPNPSQAQEVFERSTCVTTIGLTGNTCVSITNLVSTPDGGATAANGASIEPAISPDGRFVAFASTATDLGIASAGVQEVYMYDTCIGVTLTTPPTCSPSSPVLVSTPDTTTTPVVAGNSLSENPSVSVCNATTTISGTCPGGVLVAFSTKSTNLSPNVVNGVENIFVRSTCADLPTGTTACIPRTALASQPAGATAASNGNSIAPALSGDGHTVAFISAANNLVAIDTNGLPDIFLGATSF